MPAIKVSVATARAAAYVIAVADARVTVNA
jgi:hypothetical protein